MIWKKAVPLIIFLLGLSLTSASAQRIETGFLDREITLGGVSYRYQVYVPVNFDRGKTNPVILFLHSIGERGEDGMLQTQVGLGSYIRQDREKFPFIVVFPQARRDQIWTGEMATLALKTLDKTIEEFNGDPERIYVTGISMGGHGTWYVATRAPGKFAAIVPICGFVTFTRPDLPAERKAALLKVNPLAESPDPYTAIASQISKVRVWIFHGSADAIVVPEESQKMFQVLKASGVNVKYTEYEGVAHNAWDKAYSEPDLVPWLLSHPQAQAVQSMGSTPSAPTAEKGSKKTITLPNGDVVWDLNGEWDAFTENYGEWKEYGSYRNVIKIIQTAGSLVGIKMMDDPFYPKGWESIKAELDKSGFKKVELMARAGPQDCKGQISEDGNKIIIDDGVKHKVTLTRK
jgi:dienelactone hydrolase